MADSNLNIVIGGGAGQGLATVGQLMARAVVRSGFHMLVDQKYMSRIRGGHNTFSIRIGAKPVVSITEDIDILVALNDETVTLHQDKLTANGLVIASDEIDTGGIARFVCLSRSWPPSRCSITWSLLACSVRPCARMKPSSRSC